MIWKSHLYEAAGKENTHTPEPAGLQAPGLPRLRPAPCPAPLGSTWQDHAAGTQEAGGLSGSLDKQLPSSIKYVHLSWVDYFVPGNTSYE